MYVHIVHTVQYTFGYAVLSVACVLFSLKRFDRYDETLNVFVCGWLFPPLRNQDRLSNCCAIRCTICFSAFFADHPLRTYGGMYSIVYTVLIYCRYSIKARVTLMSLSRDTVKILCQVYGIMRYIVYEHVI